MTHPRGICFREVDGLRRGGWRGRLGGFSGGGSFFAQSVGFFAQAVGVAAEVEDGVEVHEPVERGAGHVGVAGEDFALKQVTWKFEEEI